VSIIRVGGLDTQWFLALSALGGAAVGFASTQTIGNFIAGLYLLAARPFKVGDHVRLGTVEGIVQEITINYTKILTIGNNVVSLINLQILQRDITNYLYESEDAANLYCYTFEIGFDHSVSTEKTAAIFTKFSSDTATCFRKSPAKC
jgi:small-conductance mechanosensitive channel